MSNYCNKKNIYIEGDLKIPLPKELYNIYVENDSKNFLINTVEEESEDDIEKKIFSIGRKKKYKYRFKAKIFMEKENDIRFILKYKNNEIIALSFDNKVIKISYDKHYEIKLNENNILIKKNKNKLCNFIMKKLNRKNWWNIDIYVI